MSQPMHRQLARLVLWWGLRNPRIPVVMAKKDVSKAFKLIWVDAHGTVIMAVTLQGKHGGRPNSVAAMYLTLVFGWMGAPGQYVVWGWGVKQ